MAALSSAASVSLLATTLHRYRLPPAHLHPISLSFPTNNHPLKLSFIKPQNPNPSFLTFSSLNPPPPPQPGPNPTPFLPTKTLAALFALAAAISAKLTAPITTALLQLKSFTLSLTPDVLQRIQFLQENVLCTAGPLFFATLKNLAAPPPSGYLNTPLVTAVASGIAKWLDIYSGVLMVRVLLSWFPNVPWERQPLSAIRDLCDPYLSLFRNVFPPVLGSLDVSPLAAFTVLGVLASILNTAKKVY